MTLSTTARDLRRAAISVRTRCRTSSFHALAALLLCTILSVSPRISTATLREAANVQCL